MVLAIPVGGLREISGELAAANPRFKLMLDRGETVRTKALQLWLTKTIDELRDPAGSGGLDPPATAYVEPFDTYCDMSHLLEAEGYAAGTGPRAVAYFCAVLPDDAEEAVVREGALRLSGAGRDDDLAGSGARWGVRLERAVRSPRSGRARPSGRPVLPRKPGRHGPLRDDPGRQRRRAPGLRPVGLRQRRARGRLDAQRDRRRLRRGGGDLGRARGRGADRTSPRCWARRRAAAIRRLRGAGDRARATDVRAGASVLLPALDGSGASPATVRSRAEGADRRCAALCRTAAGAGDPQLRHDRRAAVAASRPCRAGERFRTGGGDLGADDRPALRGRQLCRRAHGDLHALFVGRRSDRVRVGTRGLRVCQDPGVDAAARRPSRRSARTPAGSSRVA